MFELYYKKKNNEELFKCFEEIGITNVQNFIPLYKQFFSLKTSNYKNLNLNQKFHIETIKNTPKRNKFKCIVVSETTREERLCFFKFSPLLDSIKYMVGKYDSLGEDARLSLPELENNICHSKVLDSNNSAYVDGFFSYLISQLYNNCYFPHGFDFFGAFLGIKKKFLVNIADDLDYLHGSTFFHKNQNIKFKLENIEEGMLVDFDTRNYKKKLKVGENIHNTSIKNLNKEDFKNVFYLSDISNNELPSGLDLVFEFDLPDSKSRKTDSTCSSRSSNTNSGDTVDGASDLDDDENQEDSASSNSSSDNSSDVEINSFIYDFPIQVICLECMDDTLDSLLSEEKEMNNDEWQSCLFQIVITLIAYQKVFDFTHNDLHTNNIMFQKTDKKFIYYRYNQTYYKVPTFGRVFKIIDFGRAIYKYKGQVMCSDSYHSKGDAATQYNCEPYFNSKKPRLEPNPSFDLCRLACSLFDYFIEDMDDIDVSDPLVKLILQWTQDDKDRNILYKKNGDERYPDFKLYKMIARTVHNHIPQKQLENAFFNKFIIGRKKVGKKVKLVDIDKMPILTEA